MGDYREEDVSELFSPAVRFDFQKLLVTNVEIRVLIFKSRKRIEDIKQLNNYFEKAIETYSILKRGSKFLFLCFDHHDKSFKYCLKRKR